ncbi:hypothetical protein F5Y10DRAFT_292175 [Nemania abortiva]|nr:hypothetical protein F5Y10DRAFT_292175 [Nemania abortiva]
MIGGVPKARRSQTKLSKSLQQQLLAALSKTGDELPSSLIQQPEVIGDRYCSASIPTSKRPFDATSVATSIIDSVPTKRARLTQTDVCRRPKGGNQSLMRETLQTGLHQPTPRRPKQSYASFLENFVDLADPVAAWLQSSGNIRCLSDSYLYQPGDSQISRLLTISVPEMGRKRSGSEFAMLTTPVSAISPSVEPGTWEQPPAGSFTQSNVTGGTSDSGRSSVKSPVETPLYRMDNLAANHIYMQDPSEELPSHIAALLEHIQERRKSPEPALDDVRQDRELAALEWTGAGEYEVEEYFRSKIFPFPSLLKSLLQRNGRQPMARRTVPTTGSASHLKVSTPVPDMIYGYSRRNAFPLQHDEMMANNQGLMYPFFVIEFESDGPSGNMWAATNRCLGGSASCVNITERLKQRLRRLYSSEVQPPSSAVFSIALDGTQARLYVSWKQGETDFYMATVERFILQEPEHYLLFRRYVRNILDWGQGKRLQEIQQSLDLIEKRRKEASGVAKSRPPPSPSSAFESTKRRKSSQLSSLGSSKANIIKR